jgi:hypothetical protein
MRITRDECIGIKISITLQLPNLLTASVVYSQYKMRLINNYLQEINHSLTSGLSVTFSVCGLVVAGDSLIGTP